MKTKTAVLLSILTALSLVSASAQYSTNTLSFSGAAWSDGGSLDGYFTVEYDLVGTPDSILSVDVTTGDTEGFAGYHYVYNVDGLENTVEFASINATQLEGFSANELGTFSLDFSRRLCLDWQGSSPTALYLGDGLGEYSSEQIEFVGIRSLNSESGGSVGVIPEPTTWAVAGMGFIVLLGVNRRKFPNLHAKLVHTLTK